MNYTTFEVNGKEYKLVLTTKTMIELEKKLGRNPIDIIMDAANDIMPKITELVMVLWCSMQKFNHGMKFEDCCEVFDEYLQDGNTYTDFIEVVVSIFQSSGLIDSDNDTDEENPN